MTLVAYASMPHYRAHLAPILEHVPHEWRDPVLGDDVIVAGYRDLVRVRKANPSRIILAQHGAGQSYGGDPRSEHLPAYPGGADNDDVDLFLVPNDHAFSRWRRRYPSAAVAVVGSPVLDTLPGRRPATGVTVGIAAHWPSWFVPEARSAFDFHRSGIRDVAARWRTVGTHHPRRPNLSWLYPRLGVEAVDLDTLFAVADVLVADNTSVAFEFAATGRPVVLLDAPYYRREVRHGLRFWDCAMIGPTARRPEELVGAVERALSLDTSDVIFRELAVDVAFAYRGGASERAASAIRELLAQ